MEELNEVLNKISNKKAIGLENIQLRFGNQEHLIMNCYPSVTVFTIKILLIIGPKVVYYLSQKKNVTLA